MVKIFNYPSRFESNWTDSMHHSSPVDDVIGLLALGAIAVFVVALIAKLCGGASSPSRRRPVYNSSPRDIPPVSHWERTRDRDRITVNGNPGGNHQNSSRKVEVFRALPSGRDYQKLPYSR